MSMNNVLVQHSSVQHTNTENRSYIPELILLLEKGLDAKILKKTIFKVSVTATGTIMTIS